MNPNVDIISITNGWQAAVAIVLLIALFVWPNINTHLTRRDLNHQMKPNSGSSMRDAIDKANRTLAVVVETQAQLVETQQKQGEVQEKQGEAINAVRDEQVKQGTRIAALEKVVERRGSLRRRRF